MAKDKMKKIDDPVLAAKILGQDPSDLPEGAEIAGSPEASVPEGTATAQSSPPQPEQPVQQQPAAQPVQPQPAEKTADDGLSWEERAKRWQSNYDRTKAEKERLKEEAELYKQLALQNQILQQQLQKQPVQSPVQPVKPDVKEPVLSDFVGEDFDPEDAFDARTKSGKAYQQYLQARDSYLVSTAIERAKTEIRQETEAEKKQRLAIAKAKRLADKYPEFRNPFTGEPDFEKIRNELFAQQNNEDVDDWVKYKEFMDSRRAPQQQQTPAPSGDILGQIEKAAATPTSVVATPTAVEQPEKQIPKGFEKIYEVFDDIDLTGIEVEQ